MKESIETAQNNPITDLLKLLEKSDTILKSPATFKSFDYNIGSIDHRTLSDEDRESLYNGLNVFFNKIKSDFDNLSFEEKIRGVYVIKSLGSVLKYYKPEEQFDAEDNRIFVKNSFYKILEDENCKNIIDIELMLKIKNIGSILTSDKKKDRNLIVKLYLFYEKQMLVYCDNFIKINNKNFDKIDGDISIISLIDTFRKQTSNESSSSYKKSYQEAYSKYISYLIEKVSSVEDFENIIMSINDADYDKNMYDHFVRELCAIGGKYEQIVEKSYEDLYLGNEDLIIETNNEGYINTYKELEKQINENNKSHNNIAYILDGKKENISVKLEEIYGKRFFSIKFEDKTYILKISYFTGDINNVGGDYLLSLSEIGTNKKIILEKNDFLEKIGNPDNGGWTEIIQTMELEHKSFENKQNIANNFDLFDKETCNINYIRFIPGEIYGKELINSLPHSYYKTSLLKNKYGTRFQEHETMLGEEGKGFNIINQNVKKLYKNGERLFYLDFPVGHGEKTGIQTSDDVFNPDFEDAKNLIKTVTEHKDAKFFITGIMCYNGNLKKALDETDEDTKKRIIYVGQTKNYTPNPAGVLKNNGQEPVSRSTYYDIFFTKAMKDNPNRTYGQCHIYADKKCMELGLTNPEMMIYGEYIADNFNQKRKIKNQS